MCVLQYVRRMRTTCREGGRGKELAALLPWLVWAIVDASTASLFLNTLLDFLLAFTKGRV